MKEEKLEKISKQNRREFLKVGGVATAAMLAHAAAPTQAHALPALPANPVTPTAMPTRNLGKTGYKVGIFSLGGQAALERRTTTTSPCPSSRTRARPRRQLHRHVVDLRRSRALERAVRRHR